MIVSGDFPNGVRFDGTEGWIFVSRGNEAVTASDPVAQAQGRRRRWRASDPRILTSVIGPDEIHLPRQHEPSRQLARLHPHAAAADRAGRGRAPLLLGLPAAPHRDEAAAPPALGPARERFKNDDEANAMLSRPQRSPYVIDWVATPPGPARPSTPRIRSASSSSESTASPGGPSSSVSSSRWCFAAQP